MTMDQLASILHLVAANSEIAGLTIAEYLPFDEERLHKLFGSLKLFTD